MEAVKEKQELQKYAEYKDSGVEWLGDTSTSSAQGIPADWEIIKLGGLLENFSEKNHPTLPLLSITREKGVIVRDTEDDSENHNFIPDDLSGYKLLKKGQFGMNKMKAWQGSYGVSPQTGIVSPAYYIFDFTKEVYPKFFHLAIRSKTYVTFFGSASDGVRIGQWDLSKDRMKKIPFLLPPLPEQTAIARFLDEKTSKIDQAIAQKEKLIELLKERKQIIIQELVTGKKVWNPDKGAWTEPAEVKDSGVEWVGEIPKHWEVKRLRHLGSTQNGISAGADYFGSGFPFVSYSDVYKNIELPKEVYGLANSSISDRVNYSVKENDVFFTRTSETIDEVGISSVCLETIKNATFSGFLIRFRPTFNGLFKGYSKYYFNSDFHRVYFTREMTLVTRASLSQELLKNLPILIPSLKEQKEIFQFLESQSAKIDRAISLQEKQIKKLKEYKATLIDSAVTGKIKVGTG